MLNEKLHTFKEFTLYESTKDINIFDEKNYSNIEIVKEWIKNTDNINKTDKTKNTILHVCINEMEIDSAIALIKGGIDVNLQNSVTDTPLILAAIKDYVEIIKLLIEHGADINYQDDRGRTALMHSIFGNNEKTMKILIEAGTDVNIQEEDGETALMHVIDSIYDIGDIVTNTSYNMKRIELLINYSADITIKDKKGKSAIDMAKKKGIDLIALQKEIQLKNKLNPVISRTIKNSSIF